MHQQLPGRTSVSSSRNQRRVNYAADHPESYATAYANPTLEESEADYDLRSGLSSLGPSSMGAAGGAPQVPAGRQQGQGQGQGGGWPESRGSGSQVQVEAVTAVHPAAHTHAPPSSHSPSPSPTHEYTPPPGSQQQQHQGQQQQQHQMQQQQQPPAPAPSPDTYRPPFSESPTSSYPPPGSSLHGPGPGPPGRAQSPTSRPQSAHLESSPPPRHGLDESLHAPVIHSSLPDQPPPPVRSNTPTRGSYPDHHGPGTPDPASHPSTPGGSYPDHPTKPGGAYPDRPSTPGMPYPDRPSTPGTAQYLPHHPQPPGTPGTPGGDFRPLTPMVIGDGGYDVSRPTTAEVLHVGHGQGQGGAMAAAGPPHYIGGGSHPRQVEVLQLDQEGSYEDDGSPRGPHHPSSIPSDEGYRGAGARAWQPPRVAVVAGEATGATGEDHRGAGAAAWEPPRVAVVAGGATGATAGEDHRGAGAAVWEPPRVAVVAGGATGATAGEDHRGAGAAAWEPQRVAVVAGGATGEDHRGAGAAAWEPPRVAVVAPGHGSSMSVSGGDALLPHHNAAEDEDAVLAGA